MDSTRLENLGPLADHALLSWAIGPRLSSLAGVAAAARVGCFPLLAILVYVADEDPTLEAGAETLEAGVVHLDGVVLVVMLVVSRYPYLVHR
jgi:hypothetical protein